MKIAPFLRRIYFLRLVSLYHIFSHYLIYGTIFGEKHALKIKYVSIFSTNVWNIFFFLRRTQRDIIHLDMYSYKVPVILIRFANFYT